MVGLTGPVVRTKGPKWRLASQSVALWRSPLVSGLTISTVTHSITANLSMLAQVRLMTKQVTHGMRFFRTLSVQLLWKIGSLLFKALASVLPPPSAPPSGAIIDCNY